MARCHLAERLPVDVIGKVREAARHGGRNAHPVA